MIHYSVIVATALHICTQAFLFSDRPNQCRDSIDTAARMFAESDAYGQPITSDARTTEANLWVRQGQWLLRKECGDYMPQSPQEYGVCKREVTNYIKDLEVRFNRAADKHAARSVK